MIKNNSLKPMETFDKVPAGYKRNSFTAYDNYFEPLKSLPDNERLAAYDAIVAYALNGEEIIDPAKNPIANMVFGILKPYLYSDRVKSYNGKKGGAPVGSKNNPLGRGAKRTNQELTENLPKTYLKLSEVEEEVEVDVENEVEIEDKTIEDKSPIVVVEEFNNNKSSFKSVLKVALRVFCKSAGDNKTRWSCALNECEGNELWKFSLNCIFFCDCDIASVMRVGTIIDELIQSVGKEETITSVANIVRTLCVDGKYKDKGIEEKSKILIGSINKFKADCK